MTIGILMAQSVSWSREAALRIAECGHSVHIIDFEVEAPSANLRGRTELYSAGLAQLRERVAGIHTIPGGHRSNLRYVLYAPRLRKICRSAGLDVLLALWGGGPSIICWLSGIRPFALFVGGGDILRVSGLQKLLSSYAMSRAAVVFANGRQFSERTREFAPRANVVPLYYGVDTAKFTPGAPLAGPVVIVCTRSFQSAYNNDYLVAALPLMPEDLPDFRLVFTSTGESASATRALADRILTPAVRSRVTFLNGVTDEEMLANLRGAHIYASVSRYDGTSISLLEALSCGLFPVLSDIPANREWISPEKNNGILVPLDEPSSLAAALATAVRDVAWRGQTREANRRLIMDRADSRENMRQLVSILEDACSSRPPEGVAHAA